MARRRYASFTTMALLTCLGACGLDDVFAPAGAGNVVFVWLGPPDLTRDVPVAWGVEVRVDGSPLASPTLVVTFPDTTRIRYASTPDSIVGLRNGPGEVVVQLISSLASTPVDTVFRLQVHP